MPPRQRVALLDTQLELTRHLSHAELAELADASLPVVGIDPGPLELSTLLRRHGAFGATVLDGLVMNSLRIGGQTGIQLLGPGDVLVPRSELFPTWLADVESRTAAPARLGLFGDELLTAAHRWPRLVQGLYACIGEQLQRLTAQLVICQIPRVDDRILAMFWLLSESWGQVTPSGIRLPLALTHEALGALVGAARPTVTLALRKLTEQGAIIHQDSGWLLLGASPEATESTAHTGAPGPQRVGLEPWALAPALPDPTIAYAELRGSLQRLCAQHRLDREEVRERLNSVIRQRVRMEAVRDRVAEDAIRRDWPAQSV